MSYLITQSLLSAWNYMFKAQDGDAAEADFLRVLRRERGEQSPAMLAGIEFENLCYRVANGEDVSIKGTDVYAYDSEHFPGQLEPIYPKDYEAARKIADIIRSGQFQVKLSRKITVDGTDFLLYGILDCLKAGVIYDIKFKSRSLGSQNLAGSYMDSPQHPAYFRLVPEASEFRYLVSDGTDLYVESYLREDTPQIEDVIADFARYLDDAGLTPLYREKWLAKS